MKIDENCFLRGCACYDHRSKDPTVEVVRKDWVGLTDKEQTKLFTDWDEDKGWGPFIEAIEAKLKEKNT